MKNSSSKADHKAHTAVFRITNEQHQDFTELLATMPGSDPGSMYREVFTRGLRDMKAFSEKHSLFTREEVAAELGHDEEAEHDLSK